MAWLRNAVVGLFALSLLAGMLVPVYTDETGWRFQLRAGFDGVDKLITDMCGPNTFAAPPWFMMPVRHFSAFANGLFADPFWVRAAGVGCALVWLAMVLALVRRIAPSGADRVRLAMLGAGLMMLGTMPMLLVWSRPEQPLVLAFTAALLLALAEPATSAARTRLRAAALVVLAVVAMSYHLKGVFLAPLFLACLWFAARGPGAGAARGVAALLVVGAAISSGLYWIGRLDCPGDPLLKAEFARNNIGALLVGVKDAGDVLPLLGRLLANMSPLEYFGLPAPRVLPLSYWLAGEQVTQGQSFGWFVALVLAWTAACAVALAALVPALLRCWRERRLDPRAALAVVLAGAVLAWGATQAIRNVYEAIFVLPMAMLAVLLALSLPGQGERTRRAASALAVTVGALSLASTVFVWNAYGDTLLRAARQPGYVAGQPWSVGVFGYGSVEPRVLAVAARCGIAPKPGLKSPMVDDVTYFAFMDSHLPINRLGVTGTWKGSLKDPLAYLRNRRSAGAVVACSMLTPQMRARAVQDGEFCCLGPANW